MKRRVICISHTDGSGGQELGNEVAKRLALRYVDHEIVARAARKEDLDLEDLVKVEKRRSFLERLLEPSQPSLAPLPELAASEVAFSALGAAGSSGKEGYRELIREVIAETAERGNVVIVAHAASMALAGNPEALKILVTASDDQRIDRWADAKGLSRSQAEAEITEADKGRKDYLKSFYQVSLELPIHYDLVVHPDALSIEQAVEIVLAAAG